MAIVEPAAVTICVGIMLIVAARKGVYAGIGGFIKTSYLLYMAYALGFRLSGVESFFSGVVKFVTSIP